MAFNYNSKVKPGDRVESSEFMPHEDQPKVEEVEMDLFDQLSMIAK